MKFSCFLTPIHHPKFNYGLELIKSYNKYFDDDHIYLVFSSIEEEAVFKSLAGTLRYRSIVYNASISNGGIITEKKFYGLQHIYNTTDFIYVGVIDVDTEFFKTVDYNDLFLKYYQTATLWGNSYDFSPVPIIQSPFKFFNWEDQRRLFEITQGSRVYFWFNDIPVYNREYFLDFINYINYNQRVHELVWYDWDFNIYAYYLLLKGIFSVKPLLIDGHTPLNNILIEDQYIIDENVFKQLFSICRPMWIKRDIDPELMTQTFVHVHLDR